MPEAGQRQLLGGERAAGPRGALEHEHGAAGPRERDRRREAVRAGADDDRVVGHPGSLPRMPLSPLTPGPERPVHELLAEVRPRERAPADRPFVYVAMISTVDGRAALDGRSAALGGEGDLEMLLELRALADAVLIGTGTLRAEGYDRLVRSPDRRGRRQAAGLAEDPLAVLITRRFDVPWEAGLFQAAEQPVLICAGADAGEPPDVPAPVEVVRVEEPTPAALLAELRSRGVRVAAVRGRTDAARRAAGRRARRRAVPDRRAGPHRRPGRAADRGRRPPARARRHGPRVGAPARVGPVPAIRRVGSAPMRIEGSGALVAGGASGLGAATARRLAAAGARRDDRGPERREGRGAGRRAGRGVRRAATSPTPRRCRRPWRPRASCGSRVCCAGVGWAEKTAGRRGPHSLEPFQTVITVNLIGTFNVLRLAAAAMLGNEPDGEGERGVCINTASIAAYDGQIGQLAYSASKGGIVGMTLPAARDLASSGIRVVTIAPGLFDTPLLAGLPEEARDRARRAGPAPAPPRPSRRVRRPRRSHRREPDAQR